MQLLNSIIQYALYQRIWVLSTNWRNFNNSMEY